MLRFSYASVLVGVLALVSACGDKDQLRPRLDGSPDGATSDASHDGAVLTDAARDSAPGNDGSVDDGSIGDSSVLDATRDATGDADSDAATMACGFYATEGACSAIPRCQWFPCGQCAERGLTVGEACWACIYQPATGEGCVDRCALYLCPGDRRYCLPRGTGGDGPSNPTCDCTSFDTEGDCAAAIGATCQWYVCAGQGRCLPPGLDLAALCAVDPPMPS